MSNITRAVGIVLVATGLAMLAFMLFIRLTTPKRILSPIPDEVPIEGIQITVTPAR